MTGKLNCRPGDLAVVIKSRTGGQLGIFVNCIRLIKSGEVVDGIMFVFSENNFVWLIDRPLRCHGNAGQKAIASVCPDNALRPIRDQPGDDETLAWAGRKKYCEDHPASLAAVRESLEDLV